MEMQRPTIVLFDMDGTTVRHINPWLLHLLEKLDDISHKVAAIFSKVFNRHIESRPLVGYRKGKRKKLLVHRAMHKIRRKEVEEIVEPCPGIYDVLEFLQEHNVKMGIVSTALGAGYGHDVLKKFDLERYFEVSVFREDIERSKPYPDPILKALDAMKLSLTEQDHIWYIGDRHKDVKAALAAEIHLPCEIMPLAYNLNAAVEILKHNLPTEFIIMSWADLMPKLRSLFNISDNVTPLRNEKKHLKK
jgi:phosphoglycolate phosphatase